MKIIDDYPHMIFRKDGPYGAMYSMGISKKDRDGKYINGYIPVKFKKDVDVPNRTNIYIKSAWQDFYLDKNGKTVVYNFINEFTTSNRANERTQQAGNSVANAEQTPAYDPFKEFSQETIENELPFE